MWLRENGSLLYVIMNHVKVVAFGSQKLLPVTRDVESHRKNILVGPIWGENFRIFFKWCILVHFLFFSDSGAPKRCRAWGNLPPPLLTGLPVTDVSVV